VLRAGSGIFYRTATQLNQNDGFSRRTNFVSSFDAGVLPAAGRKSPRVRTTPRKSVPERNPRADRRGRRFVHRRRAERGV